MSRNSAPTHRGPCALSGNPSEGLFAGGHCASSCVFVGSWTSSEGTRSFALGASVSGFVRLGFCATLRSVCQLACDPQRAVDFAQTVIG